MCWVPAIGLTSLTGISAASLSPGVGKFCLTAVSESSPWHGRFSGLFSILLSASVPCAAGHHPGRAQRSVNMSMSSRSWVCRLELRWALLADVTCVQRHTNCENRGEDPGGGRPEWRGVTLASISIPRYSILPPPFPEEKLAEAISFRKNP